MKQTVQVPVEISFKGIRKSADIENLIHRKIARLEKICGRIITQTDRLALSSPAGRLTVLRKQGSRNLTASVDSRFRGNDS